MSERERQALGSIEDGLAGSNPALASMLGIFSRLTSGEEMPTREKIQVRRRAVHSPRRARRRPHRDTAPRRAHQLYLRLGWQQAMLLVWAVVSAGLIAVALVLTAGGHGACTPLMGTVCSRAHRQINSQAVPFPPASRGGGRGGSPGSPR